MKIKDLSNYALLNELLVEIPLEIQKRNPYYKESDPKITGYIVSQWDKGIWLRKPEVSKTQIFPFFLESLDEILEFEIITKKISSDDTRNDTPIDIMVEE